jgi:hypothetical protein
MAAEQQQNRQYPRNKMMAELQPMQERHATRAHIPMAV